MRCGEVVVPREAEWVAVVLDRWDRSRRLSLRGRTPSPAMVAGLLGEAVVVQHAVWTDDGSPVALLQVTDVHPRDGTGELALLADAEHTEAISELLPGLLYDVFDRESLRKLCLWAVEGELDVPSYLGSVACPVGRLVGHERRGPDHYVDMLVYEIWREDVL